MRKTKLQFLQREFIKTPISAKIGIAVIVLYLLCALFAPWIAPYGEAEIVGKGYLPGGLTSGFLLGTDQIGRDIFSRLIYAARTSIGISLISTVIAFALGCTFGVLSAYCRGWVDQLLSRVADSLLAMPTLIFALMLLAIFGKGIVNLILILAVLNATRIYRLSRAAALNIVVQDFVEAARLRGESVAWIVFKEIIPNIRAPLVTEFGLRFCFVFLTISALSFLGVGVQPPTADWGSMVSENKSLITYGSLAPLYPATAIVVLTVSINFVVDWILQKTNGDRDDD